MTYFQNKNNRQRCYGWLNVSLSLLALFLWFTLWHNAASNPIVGALGLLMLMTYLAFSIVKLDHAHTQHVRAVVDQALSFNRQEQENV